MKQPYQSKKQKVGAGLAMLALGAVIVGTIAATPVKSTKTVATTNKPATTTQTTSSTTSQSSLMYKDGTYTATGSYNSPGGKESIKVSITLVSNVVTASDAQSGANDPTASSYQSIFISGYKQYVVGKKLDSIKLKNVSGSSLTPQGFNDALKQIAQQAKA